MFKNTFFKNGQEASELVEEATGQSTIEIEDRGGALEQPGPAQHEARRGSVAEV